MNQIILVVALFGSLVLSEEVVRKPKLFFVSTSATTSTLQTASICYVSTAAYATCTGRKRRSAETRRSRFQSTRARKWRQGRRIPTLLDHHHLHLYLYQEYRIISEKTRQNTIYIYLRVNSDQQSIHRMFYKTALSEQ